MELVSTKTLAENETIVADALRSFTDAGRALAEIRDAKQYVDAGFATFEDYCQKRWDMERRHAYRLIESYRVMTNLQTSAIKVLPENERQTRPLSELPAEQQSEAWSTAVEQSKGATPPASIVQKIVDKFRSRAASKKKTTTPRNDSSGWTDEDLKADKEVDAAFKTIVGVYGREDTTAIKHGTIETIKRADVLFLAKLPPDSMRKIQNLIMANHWTPKKALEFVNDMPTIDSTLEDMANWCLAEKGGYFTVEIGGFLYTCKSQRAAKR